MDWFEFRALDLNLCFLTYIKILIEYKVIIREVIYNNENIVLPLLKLIIFYLSFCIMDNQE